MFDPWSIAAFSILAVVGGMIVGAVSLALGGLGGLRNVRNAMEALEARQDILADTVMREQKKKAATKSVEARGLGKRGALSDAEALAEAEAVLTRDTTGRAMRGGPGARKRPSVLDHGNGPKH